MLGIATSLLVNIIFNVINSCLNKSSGFKFMYAFHLSLQWMNALSLTFLTMKKRVYPNTRLS